jgi:hypothetical protein
VRCGRGKLWFFQKFSPNTVFGGGGWWPHFASFASEIGPFGPWAAPLRVTTHNTDGLRTAGTPPAAVTTTPHYCKCACANDDGPGKKVSPRRHHHHNNGQQQQQHLPNTLGHGCSGIFNVCGGDPAGEACRWAATRNPSFGGGRGTCFAGAVAVAAAFRSVALLLGLDTTKFLESRTHPGLNRGRRCCRKRSHPNGFSDRNVHTSSSRMRKWIAYP